jgi:hypothetical protein
MKRWWEQCAHTPCAAAPGPAHLGAAFALWAIGRAWSIPTSVLGLEMVVEWALLLFLLCGFCFTPSLVAHFDHIFHIFQIYVLQNTNSLIHVETCQYKLHTCVSRASSPLFAS